MDWKGVYQIAWKIGSNCLETVILVGIELGLFIIYLLRDATSTTILQYFYNKSQVVSCYWFEFESNSKITFLSQ